MSPVEQIKERLSITDVVSSYLKLDRAGVNLKARCPFHNERTPSFFVSPTRGSFHCFGCGKGGDVFSFIQEIEGVDFRKALEILSERAGVELKGIDPRERSELASLRALLEEATKFFEKNLQVNAQALEYLRGRGLKDETIKDFRLGYTPESWDILMKHMSSKNFSDVLIERAGLAVRGERGFYDRFRGRIMFPIADGQGRVVGFSGRVFSAEGGPASGGPQSTNLSKYINTPETVLYNKSKILYGYGRAEKFLAQNALAVLVEGQMDLILAHQAGTQDAVATSGTALTEDHLHIIRRFTDKLILAFDADAAGFSAGERGVILALSLGLDVRLVEIPEGLDPADWVLKDVGAWRSALEKALPVVEFMFRRLAREHPDRRDLSRALSKKVLPLIGSINNKIEQAHFIKMISEKTGLPEEPIRREVERLAFQNVSDKTMPPVVENADIGLRENVHRLLLGFFLWYDKSNLKDIDASAVRKEFKKITGRDVKDFLKSMTESARQDLEFQAEMYYSADSHLSMHIKELLFTLERSILEEKFTRLLSELKSAESANNVLSARSILKECQDLSHRLEELKALRTAA